MNGGELLKGFGIRWQQLTPVQKTLSILVGAGMLISIVFLVQTMGRPAYAPLFTQMDPREAGAVVEKLKSMKVPYRLTDQGRTIEVPDKQVYDVRIQLASSGALGSTGAGFELFDQKKLGMTDFEQQVGYQRALQEELRRTIVQLEGVEQARVHLVIPQKSVFIENQASPSASIAFKLKPLSKLKPEQVQGIVDLVAGSVEGLKPENIHIIDMQGNILNDASGGGDSRALALSVTNQQEVKRAYEKELEKKVQQVLEKILGPGKAVAMVTADLDFSQQQVTTITPLTDPVVLSEHTVTERGSGAGSNGGSADTQSKITTYPASDGESNGGYARDEFTKNYQVGSKQETVVQAPGTLRRLSTAVVVDGDLSGEQVQKIEEMVATALGGDSNRGDQIFVSSMAFDTSYQEKLRQEMEQADVAARQVEKEKQRLKLLQYGAVGFGLLLLAVIVVVVRLRSARGVEEPVGRQVIPIRELEREVAVTGEQLAGNVRQEEARELARQKPEDVAQILKVWLTEERGG
jgi:flagellar M-ring protein FliF